MVSIDQVKELREETGVSISECRKALNESNGDFDKAKDILRKMGRDLAGKRIDREAKSGLIHCYLHPNKKIGVMVEIRCESDFVAKSDDFQKILLGPSKGLFEGKPACSIYPEATSLKFYNPLELCIFGRD